jgi:hypothetical protein
VRGVQPLATEQGADRSRRLTAVGLPDDLPLVLKGKPPPRRLRHNLDLRPAEGPLHSTHGPSILARPRARTRGRGCLPATPCRTGRETDGPDPAWPPRTAPVGASGVSRGLPGSRQSPSPRLVRAHPEPGPLPSTGVTQLQRYYGPLRRLPRPSPEGPGARSPRPLGRPPVLPVTACVRAAPTTPASRATFVCRCIRSPPTAFV